MTENTEKKTAAAPTNEEIDALCTLYDDADKNVKDAIEKRDVFGEQIEELIAAHGFLPPRATKSKRIQGEEWKATQSQSHSVNVDGTAVQRLFDAMKKWGVGRFFRRMFRREVVFILTDDAQGWMRELADRCPGIAAELQVLFSQTLKIEGRSTTLKVEPIEEKKKKGAKKAEAVA